MSFFWRYLPKIELVKFKSIDLFPSKPLLDGEHGFESLCIASKTRTIGDALVLTPIARKLKTKYPGLHLSTYIRGFNPIVFYNNPYIDKISYLPGALYGDDANYGSGHLIQLKEQYFGLDLSQDPKPEIFLTSEEKNSAAKLIEPLKESGLPICILHAWGHTHRNVAPPEYWDYLVENWKYKVKFVQVGLKGQEPIRNCHLHYWSPREPWAARKLFALMSQADAFIGVDSGPMHIAKAFGLTSLILTDLGDVDAYLSKRRAKPYFLDQIFQHSFIYESNSHLDMTTLDVDEALYRSHRFVRGKILKDGSHFP